MQIITAKKKTMPPLAQFLVPRSTTTITDAQK
jgi:hypothetical protein